MAEGDLHFLHLSLSGETPRFLHRRDYLGSCLLLVFSFYGDGPQAREMEKRKKVFLPHHSEPSRIKFCAKPVGFQVVSGSNFNAATL